jgi:uncharacterized protein YajQ (UPF0234 family)
MAQEHSFDIVSRIDWQEVSNAVQVSRKEISTRFDFKHSPAEIVQEKEKLILIAEDAARLRSLIDVLEQKMVKRRIPLRAVQYQKIENGPNRTVKREVHFQVGIPIEKAREIVKLVKQRKFKAQAAIQGDQVRIFSPKIDTLQEVIGFLKAQDFGIHMEFANYR